MQLGRISFCDKIGWNIKDEQFKNKLLLDLENNYNIRIIVKHFEKYDSTISVGKINKYPYLATLKSNGNPYLLYLTKINSINQIIFIDKKIQSGYTIPRIILTKLHFDDELFNDTIIDGEMIKPKGENTNWLFLINDIIVHKGQYLINHTIMERLNILYNLFKTQYISDKYDICKFQIKKYVYPTQLKYLVDEFARQLPYACRGIYFVPLYLTKKSILYNFDDSLIKDTIRVKYQKNNIILKTDLEQLHEQIQDKDIKDTLQSDVIDNFKTNNFNNINKIQEPIQDPIQEPIQESIQESIQEPILLSMEQPKQLIDPILTKTSIDKDSKLDEKKIKVFNIEKTNLPDVYNLYTLQGEKRDDIIIPTLKVSKMMQKIFEFKNCNIKISFECYYNNKFKKWVPLAESVSPSL